MAADNEERLLSRIIRTREITPALEAGVEDSWFFVDENREMWKFIRTHWTKYGEVPSAVTVKDNYPTYRLLAVEDATEYLVDQLVAYRRRQKAIEVVQTAAEFIATGDHDQAIAEMSSGIATIYDEGAGLTADVDLTKDALGRFDEYLAVKTRPNGLIGYSTGFRTIDEATAGLQPEQLITIIAPPKTGKSVLAMQMAVNVHEDGFVPMFQSFEMSNIEQQHRHDAMRAHIAHSRLTRGKLHLDEEKRYKESLEKMEEMHKFYLTDSTSAMTVTGLAAKIEKIKPDIVFVDGVYLMVDEATGESNTPQALTNITRNLKRLAQKQRIPIVITTQVLLWKMKKRQVSADAIGYSSSFFQDSDVILGLQKQDEEDDSSRELRVVASRNCGPASTDLLWDWEEGKFEEYGSFGQPIQSF
jgi:replicative DNA helicase